MRLIGRTGREFAIDFVERYEGGFLVQTRKRVGSLLSQTVDFSIGERSVPVIVVSAARISDGWELRLARVDSVN